MTLSELVLMPDLRLRVLTGQEKLDRVIEWVHPTDMLDPSAYLVSGELVLTNGLWRERPEDSEVFVSHLIRAGVHGLVFAVYPDQDTPPDLVAACETTGLPLLELRDLPFRAVSEAVIDSMIDVREATQRRNNRFEAALTRAVADGEGVAGITRRLHAELDTPCLVFGRDGAVIADAGAARPEHAWATWLEAVAAGRGRRRSGGIGLHGRTMFMVESGGLGRSVADGFLIVGKSRQEFRADERSLVAIGVDHLRLEFSRLRAIRITERRFARGVLEL
ncbi:MAG TPA: PucR family transcriptional regulator ligand-binding domain-containing protein, partial [Acidimicrobiales bacterium]|nr:PucR family transcriptional regulator ligand-binding domain-containing protein [Acidimicrobiales bacterium]